METCDPASKEVLSVGSSLGLQLELCDVLFQTDDQAILSDKKMFPRDKTGSVEEEDCIKRFAGGKFSKRKTILSHRQSLRPQGEQEENNFQGEEALSSL